MVHVPPSNIVTVLPDTVQTTGVVEVNVTGSEELASAETVNGGSISCLFANGSNVIVCPAGLTTCANPADVLASVAALP